MPRRLVYLLCVLASPLLSHGTVHEMKAEVGYQAEQGVHLNDVKRLARTARLIWQASGLNEVQKHALEQLDYRVAGLPSQRLGLYENGCITISPDAAGYGWVQIRQKEAAGMDLLNVLLHEQGNALGLADSGDPEDVMNGYSAIGERRLPRIGRALGAIPGAVQRSYNTSYHNLQGGGLYQDWSNTELITANNDWSLVPSIMGFLGDYSASQPVNVDPRTLLTMDNISVSVFAQAPLTASAGDVYELLTANPTVALYASGIADAPHIVFHLDTTNCAGVNVRYTLREMDSNNVPNMVDLQFRVGSLGTWTSVPAAFVRFTTTANEVFSVNTTLPFTAANQSQVQLRVITTNVTGMDTKVGVDDIAITPTSVNAVTASAVTTSATSIRAYTADLKGTVEAASGPLVVWFQYSADSDFASGVISTSEQTVPLGTATVEMTASVSGLLPEKLYYYRIVASNASGTSRGAILSFQSSYPTASDEWFDATSGLASTGQLYRPMPGVINNAGHITFKAYATVGTGGITAANDILLMTDSSGSMRVIGQEGMLVPMGGSSSGLFNNLVITPSGCSVSLEKFATTPSSRDHGYIVSEDGMGLGILNCEGDVAECGGIFAGHVTRHAMDHAERIFFSGNLSSALVTKNTGIWYDEMGSLSPLAKEGQDLVGLTGDPAWMGNVGVMVSAAGEGASFIAHMQNNPDNPMQKTLIAGNSGLFSNTSAGLEVVARKGFELANVGKINTFNAVSRGSAGDHAFISLLAWNKSLPLVGISNDQVLLAEVGGQFHVVARENTTELQPGLKPTRFGSFYMTSSGEVIFQAWVAGSGVTTANDALLCRWKVSGGFQLLAREGQAAPGTGMNYGTFQVLSVSPAGAVALQSTLSTGIGLMRALPGTALGLVVKTGSSLVFQGFPRGILSLCINQTGAGVGGGGGGLGSAINDEGAVFTVLSLGSQDYVARIYR